MSTSDELRSCPTAEDLGAYFEGRADAESRRRIHHHIATCDECLALLRDAGAYELEQQLVEPPVEPPMEPPDEPQYWPIAAVVVLTMLAGVIVFLMRSGDPVERLGKTIENAGFRPFEGRIEQIRHVPFRANRSADSAGGPITAAAQGIVHDVRPNDADDWHTMGIAYLSLDRNHDAVSALARASRMKPESAEYRSDLAAARIAFGTAEASHDELVRAVADADAALTLDPQSSAALFNRALALERLDRKEQAAHAYEAYLANDAKSKWADEVRFRLEHLRK